MRESQHAKVVRTLLDAQQHVVTTEQLRAVGLASADVRVLTNDGMLLRLRRSVLVDRQWWERSAPWERHAVRARGFALALGASDASPTPRPLALSHHSALAVHGVSVHGVDDLVHMCRLDGRRGHRSDGLQLHGPVQPAMTTAVDGLVTVVPALACLQVASVFGAEAGLVCTDSALRTGVCTMDELRVLNRHPQLRTGGRLVRLVTELADGRRESAGESRSAWVAHQLGFPRLVPQVVIRDEHGVVVARVDFVVEGARVVVEFDGMLKYDAPGVLAAEKAREDRLRELGYEVVRLTWDDLNRPAVVRAKLRAALERAAQRAA